MAHKILMVLTSHDRLGDTGKKTGFWLEEFAAPYYVFKDAGAEVMLASPLGGQPPLDPKSDEPDAQTDDTRRFGADTEAMQALRRRSSCRRAAKTSMRCSIRAATGRCGTSPRTSIRSLIESMYAAGQAGRRGLPCARRAARSEGTDGTPLVKGKRVTGFTNTEEEAVGLTKVVPFLVEDMLIANGGQYSKRDDWQRYVITDGNLITGQLALRIGA